ncbi:hypothetical protein QJQ45_005932 [Haematococcus lacustris]|nr:hypothetical protein QJQ45_005932 [Haematococcus lacustris]
MMPLQPGATLFCVSIVMHSNTGDTLRSLILLAWMACGYGIDAKSSELQAGNLDKGHVADLIGPQAAFTSQPALSHHWARWFNTRKLANKGSQFERTVETDIVSIGVGIDPGITQAASAASDRESGQLVADQLDRWKLTKGQLKHASGHLQHLAAASSAGTSLLVNLKHITVTLAAWDAVWAVYLDPKWARQRLRLYGAQDRALEPFFKQLEKDMAEVSMERAMGVASSWWCSLALLTSAPGVGGGLTRYCVPAARWCAGPGAQTSCGGRVVLVDEHRTTRVGSAVNGQQPCERHLNKRRATRPASWKPPAGQVDLRLLRPAGSQQRDQPVRGLMWCLVAAPRKPPQAPCSSQTSHTASSLRARAQHSPASKRTEAEQAAEPTQPTQPGKGTGKGKAAIAMPTPQPGRWLDRDCNAALNMQRIGESRWRPLELCYWPEH